MKRNHPNPKWTDEELAIIEVMPDLYTREVGKILVRHGGNRTTI